MKESNVVKCFQVNDIPRSTINRTIKRFKSGLQCSDKSRKGRPAKSDKIQQTISEKFFRKPLE